MGFEVFWNQRLHAVRAIVLRMRQVAINLEHFTSDSDHVEHLWRALGGSKLRSLHIIFKGSEDWGMDQGVRACCPC